MICSETERRRADGTDSGLSTNPSKWSHQHSLGRKACGDTLPGICGVNFEFGNRHRADFESYECVDYLYLQPVCGVARGRPAHGLEGLEAAAVQGVWEERDGPRGEIDRER